MLLRCFHHFSKSLINIKHQERAHSSLPSLFSLAPEGEHIPTSLTPTATLGITSLWLPCPHLAVGGSSLCTTALLGWRGVLAPSQPAFLKVKCRLADLSWLSRLLQLLHIAMHSIIHNAKWPLWFRPSFPSHGVPDTVLAAPVTHPVLQPDKNRSTGQGPPK